MLMCDALALQRHLGSYQYGMLVRTIHVGLPDAASHSTQH
jgi:hypothetical protein